MTSRQDLNVKNGLNLLMYFMGVYLAGYLFLNLLVLMRLDNFVSNSCRIG